jgi:hypothetical protein
MMKTLLLACLLGCATTAMAQTAVDVLTFALNLECLEAEFYSYAAYGKGIGEELLNRTASLTTGGQAVMNLGTYKDTAIEIATQEKAHVAFLRAAGITTPCPTIDIGSSFKTLFNVATGGKVTNFTAYDSVESFLLASFVFEDVGVTAYLGAAPLLLATPDFLVAAARIATVESAHAGAIRADLGQYISKTGPTYAGLTVAELGNAITAARDSVANSTAETPLVDAAGMLRVAAADDNALSYTRTPSQVLKIVYLGASDKGGFFPVGLTGTVTKA